MFTILALCLCCLSAVIVERTKVSVPHLAKEWGVSTAKIMGFIKSGELRAIDISTSRDKRPRYLIDRADIEAFEAARAVVPEVEPIKRRPRRQSQQPVKSYF